MVRRFGLLHATALNMTNMIGIGPFITIPLLMSALGGPQAMLGWLVALVIVLCDSTVWSELRTCPERIIETEKADCRRTNVQVAPGAVPAAAFFGALAGCASPAGLAAG